MRVLVTGANGFIGSNLVSTLTDDSLMEVISVVRKDRGGIPEEAQIIYVGDIDENYDWSDILKKCSIVIHLSAYVHQSKKNRKNEAVKIHSVNTLGTLNLARQCSSLGIKRFIYLSSIGVNGGLNENKLPFDNNDKPNPYDNYTRSKYNAELGLQKISENTDLEVVILRPPMVYGPGAPGNFKKLLNLISIGIPLPFGSLHNEKSFIGIRNLIDVLILCIDHPDAKNTTFLVSDDCDISTFDLVNKISNIFPKKTTIFTLPLSLIRVSLYLIGRSNLCISLCEASKINILHTKETLSWSPRYSVDSELNRSVEYFLHYKK